MALIGNVSGSLTHLTDGESYLVAGSGITLTSGSSGNITIASSAGSVAGSDTQFQYNNGGAFGGAADLTFNDSTGDVTLGASTSDAKLFFRDAGNYIWSEGDGGLEVINNDGTGDDSLKLTSTAGGVVINAGKTGAGVLLLTSSHAAGGIKLRAGTGDLDIDSDDAVTIIATGSFGISGGGVSSIGTTAGALTVHGAGGINIGTTADVAIDIDADALDIDAAGALTIDSATSISIGANADKPIDIDSTTLDIDASGAITIDGTSTVSIQGAGATDLQTSSGALTLAGETLDIDASSGAFNIAGTAASTVTTSGGALALDGQIGVNIQEDGTTIIGIDTNRNVAVGPSAASSAGNGTDSVFFVSGSTTPLGAGSEIHTARSVFGGDTIFSGTIRGGQYGATTMSILKLKSSISTFGAGTVGLTPALGGPGIDTAFFVSGAADSARSNTYPCATFGGQVVTSGSIIPGVDNTLNLGGSSNRWANIYTGDLHLKNDRGDWTVIEENDYLSLRNNKNGKMFKLVMEEITE